METQAILTQAPGQVRTGCDVRAVNWGRGKLWQGWLRSWALLQANNPPAKESQLSSSSSHTHPALGRRPAGSNKENTSQSGKLDPEVTRVPKQMEGASRRKPQSPVGRACWAPSPSPNWAGEQNPCHPARDPEQASWRTRAQVGGLGSHYLLPPWTLIGPLGPC